MNQSELARVLGVSRAYVTMLINGKRKPSKTIVNKLKLMDVNISKLIPNGVQEVAGSSPATPIFEAASTLHKVLTKKDPHLLTKFLQSRRQAHPLKPSISKDLLSNY